jgi:hypothetical protein
MPHSELRVQPGVQKCKLFFTGLSLLDRCTDIPQVNRGFGLRLVSVEFQLRPLLIKFSLLSRFCLYAITPYAARSPISIQINPFKHSDYCMYRLDSVVGIATGYGLDD